MTRRTGTGATCAGSENRHPIATHDRHRYQSGARRAPGSITEADQPRSTPTGSTGTGTSRHRSRRPVRVPVRGPHRATGAPVRPAGLWLLRWRPGDRVAIFTTHQTHRTQTQTHPPGRASGSGTSALERSGAAPDRVQRGRWHHWRPDSGQETASGWPARRPAGGQMLGLTLQPTRRTVGGGSTTASESIPSRVRVQSESPGLAGAGPGNFRVISVWSPCYRRVISRHSGDSHRHTRRPPNAQVARPAG
jgi:hypothetical protein